MFVEPFPSTKEIPRAATTFWTNFGGTTRTLYHNIFAFGLEELEQFHTLQENEVAPHISGAGLGVGAARWTSVQRDLEERQGALYLPRGQNSTINVAFKELDSVRDDLDRTEHQPQDYWAAHEARTRLTSELATLEDAVGALRKRIEHYEQRRTARPMMERRGTLEAKLKDLPVIETFPEGGIERLDLLQRQLQSLKAELTRKQTEIDSRRFERIALSSVAGSAGTARRRQVIDSLKNFMPRMDAARRVYASCLDRRDAIAQEKKTLDTALEGVRPPSKLAFMVFLALIWAGAGGLFWSQYEYIAAGVLFVSLFPLFWYRSRIASFGILQKKVFECAARLAACQMELKKTEDEARQIESEVRRLTGQVEITAADIELRLADLDQLLKVGDEIRKFDEGDRPTRDREEDDRPPDRRNAVESGGASGQRSASVDESDFIERSEIFKQRLQLITSRD